MVSAYFDTILSGYSEEVSLCIHRKFSQALVNNSNSDLCISISSSTVLDQVTKPMEENDDRM